MTAGIRRCNCKVVHGLETTRSFRNDIKPPITMILLTLIDVPASIKTVSLAPLHDEVEALNVIKETLSMKEWSGSGQVHREHVRFGYSLETTDFVLSTSP